MHNFIVNPSHLSLVACIILLLIFTGCDDHKPSPISSNTPTSASKDFTFITDKLLGNWIGPEGTFLLLTGGDGKYQITIQNLDGPRTFQGRVAGNQIEFERDGVKLSLHASTGI